MAMGEYRLAVSCLGKALKNSLSSPVTPGLLTDYIEACKKMNNI
jgi:hypothetical protein